MVRVILEWDGKRADLDIDIAAGVPRLMNQIQTITQITPQQQQIIGIGPGFLTASSDLHQLGSSLVQGQRVFVQRYQQQQQQQQQQHHPHAISTTTASSPASSSSSSPPAIAPQLTNQQAQASLSALLSLMSAMANSPKPDLSSACTRVWLGSSSSVQPSAFGPSGARVCFLCAVTCFPHNACKPVPHTDQQPFVCQCHQTGHECLFQPRVESGAEVLFGAPLFSLCATLSSQVRSAAAAAAASGPSSSGAAIAMFNRLSSNLASVLDFENAEWQSEARKIIPRQELEEKAKQNIRLGIFPILSFRDAVLKELLHWFKFSFFSWTNSPKCSACGSSTSGIGATHDLLDTERPYRPGVVELYKCSSTGCRAVTRFPRFNHACKLLSTRTGRCGEWAQAFTLCCRAMGYEARLVHDWTDHVWTEVFSEAEQRWVHCDSCENARDAPMMYESGWGKKLTYVIAFSVDEVVDVTRRYTKKFAEVLSRRTLCSESALSQSISQLSHTRLSLLSASRRSVLSVRSALEESELSDHIIVRSSAEETLKEEERRGRISGEEAWRRARGELGEEGGGGKRTKPKQEKESKTEKEKGKEEEQEIVYNPYRRFVHPPSGEQPSSSRSPLILESSSSSSSSSSPSSGSGSGSSTTTSTPLTAVTTRTPPSSSSSSSSSSSTSSSSSSTTTTTTSSSASSSRDSDSVTRSRSLAQSLFNLYLRQVSAGCGSPSCPNQLCRSSSSSQLPLSQLESKQGQAKYALNLMQQFKANKLCEAFREELTKLNS